MATHIRVHINDEFALAGGFWRGSDMRLRLGARADAALLTRASADMHARARALCSCVFTTGTSFCTTTSWRACRRPSSPASRASRMSRSLSPRPHTLARTRNSTCSALLSSAFPVASLAFLPPFFVYRSLIRRLEYPYEAWISVARVCMLYGCASVSERALLCLFLCVSRCFRGETVRTAYSTYNDMDIHGHAHSCAHK